MKPAATTEDLEKGQSRSAIAHDESRRFSADSHHRCASPTLVSASPRSSTSSDRHVISFDSPRLHSRSTTPLDATKSSTGLNEKSATGSNLEQTGEKSHHGYTSENAKECPKSEGETTEEQSEDAQFQVETLDSSEDPRNFSMLKKCVIVFVISAGAMCTTCASSAVRTSSVRSTGG